MTNSLRGVHQVRETTYVLAWPIFGTGHELMADGDRAGVELTVLGKRRIQYEEELAYDGTNYDAWFSLARLEEDAYRADKEDGEDVEPTRVREVYERAVANVPPATEKR